MQLSKWRSSEGARLLSDAGGEFSNETLGLAFDMMKFLAMKYDWDEHEQRGWRLLQEREALCLAALAQQEPINSAPTGMQSA